MSKSIKLKDDTYWDSNGITHNEFNLKTLLNNLICGADITTYTPHNMAQMSSGQQSSIIDISKTNIFATNWISYESYDSRFAGCLGIYIKGISGSSVGGVAIIFFYGGSIGYNVRIDGARWSGWKWLA